MAEDTTHDACHERIQALESEVLALQDKLVKATFVEMEQVAWDFKAGFSVEEVAKRRQLSPAQVEDVIRAVVRRKR